MQATVPESLIPLSFAQDPNCSVVLAGDPFQLGPVVHSSQAAASGFGASLLEMFMTHREKQAAAEEGIVQLTRNYRSHQDLLDLPSQLFYRGVLRAACDPEDVALPGTISESFDLGARPPHPSPVDPHRRTQISDEILHPAHRPHVIVGHGRAKTGASKGSLKAGLTAGRLSERVD